MFKWKWPFLIWFITNVSKTLCTSEKHFFHQSQWWLTDDAHQLVRDHWRNWWILCKCNKQDQCRAYYSISMRIVHNCSHNKEFNCDAHKRCQPRAMHVVVRWTAMPADVMPIDVMPRHHEAAYMPASPAFLAFKRPKPWRRRGVTAHTVNINQNITHIHIWVMSWAIAVQWDCNRCTVTWLQSVWSVWYLT